MFGWLKTVGGGRKLRYCGVAFNGLLVEMALAAYNLVRMAKLMPPHHLLGGPLPVEDDMPQPEAPAAQSRATQGAAYSESSFNGASMPTPSRSLYPKPAFFISLLGIIGGTKKLLEEQAMRLGGTDSYVHHPDIRYLGYTVMDNKMSIPRCSPYPVDIMAIYALYQTLDESDAAV